jgi:CDP-diacylglycerol--glycerol-3-phosphate 3-phosphatidyltransferase
MAKLLLLPTTLEGFAGLRALDPAAAILLARPMAVNPNLVTIPNLLTYGRIVAIPVIVLLLVAGYPALRWLALILYLAAAVSDFFDGYLARRWNQSSPLGRMLDPIADKLLVGALIVTFAWDRSLSGWDLIPALAILLREIFVSGLREYLGPKNVVVKVTQLAKWKTTVQLLALTFIFLAPLLAGAGLVAELLLWLAGILTVITGVQYFQTAWPHLSGEAP